MSNTNLEVIKQQQVLGKEFKIYGDFENPMFLAKDVAEWIEHSNPRVMLNTVDENEKVVNNVYTLGGVQESWFLTEDGLYEVLMQSRKPIAKAFKKEVKTILKEIRKNGGYIATKEDDTDEDIMARALIIAQKTIERKAQRIKELEGKVEEDKPKVEYYDKVLDTDTCFTTTQIAKELEMSARQLNLILSQMGIQYKQSGQWLLRAEYQDKGYVKTRTHVYKDKDGTMQSKLSTVWTQKGREFLIDLSEDF